jgi:hypothetical protein
MLSNTTCLRASRTYSLSVFTVQVRKGHACIADDQDALVISGVLCVPNFTIIGNLVSIMSMFEF